MKNSSPLNVETPSLPFRYQTIDIVDRLCSMIVIGLSSHYRCRDYIRRSSERKNLLPGRHASVPSVSISGDVNIVSNALRTKIVQWLYECVDFLDLSRECVAVAISYVDRLMSSSRKIADKVVAALIAKAKVDTMMYQLMAVSSLFLAMKQNSCHCVQSSIDAFTFVRLSYNSYSAKDIIEMERAILVGLEWRLCEPTSLSFAHDAIALLAKTMPSKENTWQRIQSVLDFSILQIEMSVLDYNASVLTPRSVIALASIANSMELLDFTTQEKRAFSRKLSKLNIGIREDIFHSPPVEKAREDLHRIFDRQLSSIIDRAILKLSSTTITGVREITHKEKDQQRAEKHDRKKSLLVSKSPVQVVDSDAVILASAKRSRSYQPRRRAQLEP